MLKNKKSIPLFFNYMKKLELILPNDCIYLSTHSQLLQDIVLLSYHMPCLFKTAVKDSGIQGKGFFSLEDIPKGAVYWVY